MQKPKKNSLTDFQRDYILQNRLAQTVPEMSRNLGIDSARIFIFLRGKKLDFKYARKPRRGERAQPQQGFFNVHQYENWIV